MTARDERSLNSPPAQHPAAVVRALLEWTTADQVTVPRAALEALLSASPAPVREPDDKPARVDHLLKVREAAARMDVSVSWLYRHGRKFAFAKTIGTRGLRFSAHGLERWIATRPPT